MLITQIRATILFLSFMAILSCGQQQVHSENAKRQIAATVDVGTFPSDYSACTYILRSLVNHQFSPNQVNPTKMSALQMAASQLSFTPLSQLKGRPIDPIEELLKSEEIIALEYLGGGVNISQLATFKSGIRAVWKPHILKWSSNYRTEVLAYEIDRKFGFNLVPPTVERTIDNKKGTIQLFMQSGHKYFDQSKELADKYLLGLKKMSFFDFLIDQRDRHLDNYLASLDGDVIAIDNGLSFTGKGYNEFATFEFRQSFIDDFLRSDEGKRIINQLRSLNINDFRNEVEAYLGKKDTDDFFKRIRFIIEYNDKLPPLQ